jgi:hypothetical protein
MTRFHSSTVESMGMSISQRQQHRTFTTDSTGPTDPTAACTSGRLPRMNPTATRTLALLGDSILDNGFYTKPQPDTAAHLRGLLGVEWSVASVARDGATTDQIGPQLLRLPPGRPDVAVLSVGGNDLVQHVGILAPRVASSSQLFSSLLDIADRFEKRYTRVLEVLRPGVERLIVCTIYEAPLSGPEPARMALVPLAVFNDRIIRVAGRFGAEVLELREVCTQISDFVEQIEPSGEGARKIAAAIATAVNW